MEARLIITSGDVAISRLRETGVEATFLPWRDPLHDGPVIGGLMLEALSLIRSQFLAKDLGRSLTALNRNFEDRDRAARNHGQFERVELWFEHDLYDQLQLIQVLDFFAGEKRNEGLYLVQADDYLGTMPADSLRGLGTVIRPVDAQHFDAAKRGWAAFTAATPEKLAAFTIADTPAMPHLVPSLRRYLQEFPGVASGLSLTEERVLALLIGGEQSVSELFRGTQEQESARFLGDLSFFRRLDGLAFCRLPLITGLPFPSLRCADGPESAGYRTYAAAKVTLTQQARGLMAGRFDHAIENAIDRWFGGTHVTPKAMWRRGAQGKLARAPLPPVRVVEPPAKA